ncbi:MAG: aminoacyl-tRNA hydrolase [Microthrixaceae bacterium]|nr:aminoacyl-tRNA hydrolase [Microthrixaceae bacterium]MCO5317814.1 aminoacyl-tRNA hydrolase [Microthrixaceae bacterium]
MPEDLPVDGRLVIPAAELSERFLPSGGPGGQHANKASTRVELRFDVAASGVLSPAQRRRLRERIGDDVRVVVDDERSQARNRAIARERLAGRIRNALVVETRRRATRPTRGSQRRRLESKKQRSELKKQRRRPEF